jgi:large subunit ribosomal protein L28
MEPNCIFALRFEKIRGSNPYITMSKVCEITGKRVRRGNNVSHANNKSKRTFSPNLHKKRFYIPEEDKWVTIKVSSSALRTINKNGITATLKDAKKKGLLTAKI